MKFAQAKQLHNHDQVQVKASQETVEVISTEVADRNVWIFAMTENGFTRLHHRDVK